MNWRFQPESHVPRPKQDEVEGNGLMIKLTNKRILAIKYKDESALDAFFFEVKYLIPEERTILCHQFKISTEMIRAMTHMVLELNTDKDKETK